MIGPESKLFCRLDRTPDSERERQRLLTLTELALLETESVPIFEEATQTAAHFLDAPICILGLMDLDRQWFKSAVGLSRIRLMNDLASSRQLPRHESFCTHVVESYRALAVNDAATHPAFADSILVQQYGIRGYLGVPLIASNGHCLGTLAIMELQPRDFSTKDIEFLELTARWSMSEYERNYLLKQRPIGRHHAPKVTSAQQSEHSDSGTATSPAASYANSTKVNLISQMTQELRTPLTSILGMASVLTREIYGPLTDKQKEYINIVHNSGQYLLSLVNEILELGSLDDSNQHLNLSPVDIEMLCQQAINTLKQAAQRRDQEIRLTVEPGPRIWLLDKDKVRQMLYHLVFSVIQSASTDSIVRIHVSRKQNRLNVTVWTSHPWLGDGLPQAELYSSQFFGLAPFSSEDEVGDDPRVGSILDEGRDMHDFAAAHLPEHTSESPKDGEPSRQDTTRQSLGLMLSRQLAEMHGGAIAIQGSSDAGYRYVVSLPQLKESSESDLL